MEYLDRLIRCEVNPHSKNTSYFLWSRNQTLDLSLTEIGC